MMTYEYDESCNAYGPEPHSADKARWAAVWARMAHDRNAERAADRTA